MKTKVVNPVISQGHPNRTAGGSVGQERSMVKRLKARVRIG